VWQFGLVVTSSLILITVVALRRTRLLQSWVAFHSNYGRILNRL